jgi:hypothetical protein
MGKLQAGILFTGTLGNLSAYRRSDSGDIHVRLKSGPSRKAIKNSPRFEKVRQNNAEFGARSSTTKEIRRALSHHWHVADYNFSGPLNALLHPIQKLDANFPGKRSVFLSRHRKLLEGFTLNQKFSLDNYVRAGIACSLTRDTAQATVEIPTLYTGVNFFSPQPQSWFRFVVSLGSVSDRIFDEHKGIYVAAAKTSGPKVITTDWYFWGQPFEGTKLTLTGPSTLPDALTLILTVGIEFGKPDVTGEVQPIKKGAAKIMAAV